MVLVLLYRYIVKTIDFSAIGAFGLGLLPGSNSVFSRRYGSVQHKRARKEPMFPFLSKASKGLQLPKIKRKKKLVRRRRKKNMKNRISGRNSMFVKPIMSGGKKRNNYKNHRMIPKGGTDSLLNLIFIYKYLFF